MSSEAAVEAVGASTQAALPGLSVLRQRESDPAGRYSELSLLASQPYYKCSIKPGIGCRLSADSALKDCPARPRTLWRPWLAGLSEPPLEAEKSHRAILSLLLSTMPGTATPCRTAPGT